MHKAILQKSSRVTPSSQAKAHHDVRARQRRQRPARALPANYRGLNSPNLVNSSDTNILRLQRPCGAVSLLSATPSPAICCGKGCDNLVRPTRWMSSFAPKSSMLGQWIRSAVWFCTQRQIIVVRQQLWPRAACVSIMATSRRERHVAIMDTVRRCRCLPIVCRCASSSWAGPSENSLGEPVNTEQRSDVGWPARAISILPSRNGSRCWSPSMSLTPAPHENHFRFLMPL